MKNNIGLNQKYEYSRTPIGAWEVKLEIMTDQQTNGPTDRPTDGHEGSWGSFTSINNYILSSFCSMTFKAMIIIDQLGSWGGNS